MNAEKSESLDTLGILKVYTGQGFLSPEMGMDVLKEYKEVQKLYETAHSILRRDIRRLCEKGTLEEQKDTRNQQAMVYLSIAALILKTQGLLFTRDQYWKCPEHERYTEGKNSFYVGFSLGEILALLAARKFSFVDGLRIIKKRSELMGKKNKGSLANVIGAEEEKLKTEISAEKTVDLAIISCEGNISVGGYDQDLNGFFERIKREKIARKIIPSATSGAFHTRLYAKEAEEYRKFLIGMSHVFLPSQEKVIANVDAKPYTGAVQDTINKMSNHMWQPVLFKPSVKSLEGQIDEIHVIGPGAKKLADNVVKRIIDNVPVVVIEDLPSLKEYWQNRMPAVTNSL